MNTISITHSPLANGMPDQRSAKILWIHSPLTDGHMTSGHNIRSESMTGGQVTGGHILSIVLLCYTFYARVTDQQSSNLSELFTSGARSKLVT